MIAELLFPDGEWAVLQDDRTWMIDPALDEELTFIIESATPDILFDNPLEDPSDELAELAEMVGATLSKVNPPVTPVQDPDDPIDF